MTGIISSFHVLSQKFKAVSSNSKDPRVAALQHYFHAGGVISVGSADKEGWPELVYPSKPRLEEQLKEKNEFKELFSKKKNDWKKEFRDAQWYNVKNHAKKFADPLYWKHVQKSLTDKSYRDDVKRIQLPTQLVSDKRYRAMVDMFVNDIEYRKQLAETVENSIAYKDNKKVARYANELQAFRKKVSENRLKELEEKLDEVELDIQSIRVMLQWAKK